MLTHVEIPPNIHGSTSMNIHAHILDKIFCLNPYWFRLYKDASEKKIIRKIIISFFFACVPLARIEQL